MKNKFGFAPVLGVLLVCVLLPLLAQESGKEAKNKESATANPALTIAAGVFTGDIDSITAASNPSSFIIYDDGEVLKISGLYPPHSTGTGITFEQKMSRPEKPDEISVTLYTKDGKKWRAKWEEEK